MTACVSRDLALLAPAILINLMEIILNVIVRVIEAIQKDFNTTSNIQTINSTAPSKKRRANAPPPPPIKTPLSPNYISTTSPTTSKML